MSDTDDTQHAERLPLWRNVAEHIEQNHKPGDMIETAWLLKRLRHESAESMRFGLDVANIRRYLESSGMYLSGTGFKGEKFTILHPKDNIRVMQSYSRAAVDKLSRSVTLGNATDRSALTTEEATKHESYLGKLAARLALIGRRNPEKILEQTSQPKLKELNPA
jgi:hypothetical protein